MTGRDASGRGESHRADRPIVMDPVCWMQVDPERTPHHSEWEGRSIHFCSVGCKKQFDAAPERYGLHRAAERPDSPSTRTGSWTCPMHPEIVRDRPGSCPKCGMALEPVSRRRPRARPSGPARCTRRSCGTRPALPDLRHGARAADVVRRTRGRTAELRDMSAPLLVLGGAHSAAPRSWRWATCSAGEPDRRSALSARCARSARARCWRRRSVSGRRGRSSCAAVAVGAEPQPQHVHADRPRRGRGLRLQRGRDALARASSRPPFRDATAQVAVYFEAAAVIVTLVLLGQVLELRARSQTSAAIQEAARPGAEDRAPHARRRRRRGRAARRRAGRRPAARAARREGPGRRRRARGHELASTSRWSPASRSRCEKQPGDKVVGATVNGTGALRHARREGRRRDAARADRRDGRRGPAQPRADPEARRRRVRLLRAGRHR